MNTLPISLCDVCRNPGRCCKRMTLTKGGDTLTFWDNEDVIAGLRDLGLPFVPLEKIGSFTNEQAQSYSWYWYGCPLLQPDGRCGDYLNRPPVCRAYVAGSNPLCGLMYMPQPAEIGHPKDDPSECKS
jgi:Fe-S-cluster containining protein